MIRRASICVVLLSISGVLLTAAQPSADENRKKAQQQFVAGNFRDAYNLFRKLALDPNADVKLAASDLKQGIACLSKLRRVSEIDEFREAAATAHKDNWRVLHQAARSLRSVPHYGYIIAGEFERGSHRGGGRIVDGSQRDRVRMLQLMNQAIQTATFVFGFNFPNTSPDHKM